jgi:hypothetical protein
LGSAALFSAQPANVSSLSTLTLFKFCNQSISHVFWDKFRYVAI